jgi:uncharacterized protein YbaP (TraB family)
VDEEKVMKSKSLILAFILIFTVGCVSEPKYQVKRPFLYEVKKDNKKAYIFGTIHVGVGIDDLPTSFWPYFNEGNMFVSESMMSGVEAIERETELGLVHAPGQPHLSEVFSLAELQEISNYLAPYLEKHHVNLDDFSAFGIYTIIRLMISSKEDNIKVEKGEYTRLKGISLDKQLLQKASSIQGKAIAVLDDPDVKSLVRCYLSATTFWRDEVRKLLSTKTVNANEVAETLRDIAEYREGSEDSPIDRTAEVPECLLKERNQLWLPKIISIIERYNRPFFAVGADHLHMKKDSLIALLEQQGFTVRRVKETFLTEK